MTATLAISRSSAGKAGACALARLRRAYAEIERPVEGLHRALDLGGRDVAGDLDRRRRDDHRLDAGARQRGERLGGDAGMALHARTDEAHLAEVVAGVPVEAEAVERARRVGAILRRRGEDDLGAGLDDRVDVDARV